MDELVYIESSENVEDDEGLEDIVKGIRLVGWIWKEWRESGIIYLKLCYLLL